MDIEVKLSEKDKGKIDLLQKFIEWITGKKIKFVVPKDFKIYSVEAIIWSLNNDSTINIGSEHRKHNISMNRNVNLHAFFLMNTSRFCFLY
ncbi:MAG: hypothetical protein N2645_11730 [Clostridia bacterium]|nr:hypothetical protein [Clostridia bacterium]